MQPLQPKRLNLAYDADEPTDPQMADPESPDRMVVNRIQNAGWHGGGRVAIKLRLYDAGAIVVADEGARHSGRRT